MSHKAVALQILVAEVVKGCFDAHPSVEIRYRYKKIRELEQSIVAAVVAALQPAAE